VDDLPTYFPLIGCALPLVLVMIGIAIAIVLVFRRSLSLAERQRGQAQAERWVEEQVDRLEPWREGSLNTLSNFATFRWQQFISEKVWGTIDTTSGDGPLVAFASIWAWTWRQLYARTTRDRWSMVFAQNTISISLNGEPFGAWQTKEGVLLDASGDPIGSARRGSTTWINDLPTSWHDRWYEVTLRGEVVGAVLAQRGLKRRPLFAVDRGPAVMPAQPQLPVEAEQWLLTLAIVELGWTQVKPYT